MSDDSPARLLNVSLSKLNRASFAPFGELILPAADGTPFDTNEARLDLTQGQPRFYIMRAAYRGMSFHRITRHLRVTQCLAARNDRDWFIAVAPPDNSKDRPALEDIKAFHVPGETALKLHRGTWHAGPYFSWDRVDFFNLELTDTNQCDSQHFDLSQGYGVELGFDVD